MEEKHGLALFCVFILGWTLFKVATKPAPREPVSFPERVRTAAPRQTAVADPAPAPRPTETGGAPGGPPAMTAFAAAGAPPAPRVPEAYGSAESEPAPASAGASASPRLGNASGFQLSSEAGARASASVQNYASPAAPERAFAAGASRPGSGAAQTAFASAGAGDGPAAARRASATGDASARGVAAPPAPGSPARSGASADAASALDGGTLPSFAKPAAPPRMDAAAGGGDSGGGGGGGGGGGDGGGLSGGGGGGGLSDGGINARPTSSAGKPADAEGTGSGAGSGAGAAASGSGGGSSGFGGGGPSSAAAPQEPLQEPTTITPIVGSPVHGDAKRTDDLYADKHGGARTIPIFEIKNEAGKTVAVKFTGKMSIDADGAGNAYKSDRTGQGQTSLKIGGASLNPLLTPYAVKPTGFGHGVELGDYVAVTYGGHTSVMIVGDNGPSDEVGECSISCAKSLGINHDPNSGGVRDGVTYLFLAGSRDNPPSADKDANQKRGTEKFAAVNIHFQ